MEGVESAVYVVAAECGPLWTTYIYKSGCRVLDGRFVCVVSPGIPEDGLGGRSTMARQKLINKSFIIEIFAGYSYLWFHWRLLS